MLAGELIWSSAGIVVLRCVFFPKFFPKKTELYHEKMRLTLCGCPINNVQEGIFPDKISFRNPLWQLAKFFFKRRNVKGTALISSLGNARDGIKCTNLHYCTANVSSKLSARFLSSELGRRAG